MQVENYRIAFGGFMAAGKSVAARYLMEQYGFQLLGFATPLYELEKIHRQHPNTWEGSVSIWADKNLTPIDLTLSERLRFTSMCVETFEEVAPTEGKNRTLLQLVGTEVGRAVDQDLWVKIFSSRVENMSPHMKVVNDNLRFKNEFEGLKDLGFITVLLDVDADTQDERYLKEYGQPRTPEQRAHRSEAELEGLRGYFDVVIENNGSLEELQTNLDGLVRIEVPA